MTITLDKVKIFKTESGKPEIITFLRTGMLEGETEEDFMVREINKLKQLKPAYKTLPIFEMTKNDVKNVINSHPKGHKRRLEITGGGTLKVKPSIQLQEEINEERETKAKGNLKNLGLDDEDIETIMGKNKNKKKNA